MWMGCREACDNRMSFLVGRNMHKRARHEEHRKLAIKTHFLGLALRHKG